MTNQILSLMDERPLTENQTDNYKIFDRTREVKEMWIQQQYNEA